jgi:peptidyl-prolyl cis-trans isomerase D
MLDVMRKHARNWIMKTLLGIIIIVFIFYFGSMGGRQKADALVTIDGKTISMADFQKQYQDLVEMYRQRFGGRLPEELLKAMNMKEQVLDKMVHETILIKKAEELHVGVSDEEVKEVIVATPAFQRNGAFDEKQYQQMLRYNRLTPEDYEARQKRAMVVSKLEDLMQDGISVSEAEIYNFYRTTNEKISIAWARLPIRELEKDIRPSAADLDKYLKDHGNEFRVPEQVKVKVAQFTPQAYFGEVKVTDDEVQEAYNRYKGQQGKAGKVEPLAAVKEKMIGEIKHSKGMRIAYDAAKKAHDTIYQQSNFEAYTAQHRLQTEVTGFFTAKNPPQQLAGISDFAKIAFSLQKDEISKILSSSSGYYIMKLEEKKASYTPTTKEIEPELRRRYLEDESRRLARQEAERLLGKMKAGERLNKIASERRLTVAETGLFLPSSPPPSLGPSPELRRALFQLSETKTYADQVFYHDGAFLLLEFRERSKVDDSDFANQKPALKNALLRIKKTESIQSWMEATKAAMIKDGRIKFHKETKDL